MAARSDPSPSISNERQSGDFNSDKENLFNHDSQPAAKSETAVTPDSRTIDFTIAKATRVQARATIFSAAAAVVALIVSTASLLSQLSINRTQETLNIQAADRQERIYSSRVAFQAKIGDRTSSLLPEGLDVQIQNRSPITAYEIFVRIPVVTDRSADIAGIARVRNLPPCSTFTFRIAPPDGWSIAYNKDPWLGYTEAALAFSMGGIRWSLTFTSLDKAIGARPTATIPEFKIVAIAEDELGECGETG